MRIPKTPPPGDKAIDAIVSSDEKWKEILERGLVSATVDDRYIHWDKLLFRTPPVGITHEHWWGAIKLARMTLRKDLPLLDTAGKPFAIATPDPMQEQLSDADRDLSGRVPLPEQIANTGTRDRYLISALIEEAITSSQLEGAATTRRVAADMLRSGRQPRDHGEQMIFNNFLAMRFIREHAKEPLTKELILQVHRRVTENAIDDPNDAGRFRTTDDIHVKSDTGETLHIPPGHDSLQRRMDKFCAFANGETPRYFIHPIVRAVLIHFWIGYDHPFADGNGRTARALFYWSMLHSGYWLCEYISISHYLKQAPSKYSLAYLYAESDENDATYFVLYQLSVLRRAIEALHEYVQQKAGILEQTSERLKHSQRFNHRQLAVLGHALGNPNARYSVSSHATSHQVVRQTARTDLQELVDLGFLTTTAAGKAVAYLPVPDLDARLSAFSEQ